jgi:hypothetical protein
VGDRKSYEEVAVYVYCAHDLSFSGVYLFCGDSLRDNLSVWTKKPPSLIKREGEGEKSGGKRGERAKKRAREAKAREGRRAKVREGRKPEIGERGEGPKEGEIRKLPALFFSASPGSGLKVPLIL